MPRVIHEIHLEVLDDGRVQLKAPMHDKVLCFGLLELAKDLVREKHRQTMEQPKQLVQIAPVIPSLGKIG